MGNQAKHSKSWVEMVIKGGIVLPECKMHKKRILQYLRVGDAEIPLCDDCLMYVKSCVDAQVDDKKKKKTKEQHTPCKHRKRETRDGVTLDWCYAIGCCEVGDMPCEYCNEQDK